MSPRMPLLVLCLALAACSRPQPNASSASVDSPSDAPIPEMAAPASTVAAPKTTVLNGVDLSQPVTLTGTETFWSVKVTDAGITLSRPDAADTGYMPADFVVNGNRATLESGDMTVTLVVAACSDGMSERSYPLTAEVHLGDQTLNGCAISTADMMAKKPQA